MRPGLAFRWVYLAVCVCSAPMVGAVDLQQAYQAALAQDAVIRVARAQQQSAQERLPQATAQLLPSLSFAASRSKNNSDTNQLNFLGQMVHSDSQYTSYNQTLQLRQPLWRKSLWIARDAAMEVGKDADAQLAKEQQNLVVRIASAYLQVLLAQDQIDLVLKEREFILASLDAARKSLQAGAGTRTDIDEAQAQLDMNLAQELDARQGLALASRQLEVMTQLPDAVPSALAQEQFVPTAPVPADVAHWIREAEQNSPELQARQAQLKVAELEIDKASAAHQPTLDAVAQVTRSGSESVTSAGASYIQRSVGLQLNVPIYSGGYISSTVRQALADRDKAQEQLEATRRDLTVQVSREYFGVQEGLAKIKALRQAEVSARQLVLSSRKSQQAGVRTLLDVLNAEQKLQTVLRDLAQAKYVYIRAWLALTTLAGQDPAEAVASANRWFAGQ